MKVTLSRHALIAGACLTLAASAPSFGQSSNAESVRAAPVLRKVSPYQSQKLTAKAKNYYLAAWGVDKLKVSSTSSGNLIRFTYRVADAERAKPLASKAAAPYLVAQRNNVALQVPVMDMVGQLRQATTPQPGQEYWMVFSNKGNLVRPGDRVNIVIGQFHADGLVVE
jgi:hypothetical protein